MCSHIIPDPSRSNEEFTQKKNEFSSSSNLTPNFGLRSDDAHEPRCMRYYGCRYPLYAHEPRNLHAFFAFEDFSVQKVKETAPRGVKTTNGTAGQLLGDNNHQPRRHLSLIATYMQPQ